MLICVRSLIRLILIPLRLVTIIPSKILFMVFSHMPVSPGISTYFRPRFVLFSACLAIWWIPTFFFDVTLSETIKTRYGLPRFGHWSAFLYIFRILLVLILLIKPNFIYVCNLFSFFQIRPS